MMNKQEIIDMYKSGASYRAISQASGKDISSTFKIIRKSDAFKPRSNRKWEFNEKFFSSIDSPEKAYWLGFILADAYIQNDSKNKLLRFNLSSKDKNHLEKFKETIGYHGPTFETYKGEWPITTLSISSCQMVSNLIKLGANDFKRKGDLSLIDRIPLRYQVYLIRGLFDGDGMVYFHKPSRQAGMGFCDANKTVVTWMRNTIATRLQLKLVSINVNKSGNCFRFQYRGNRQVPRIMAWLYDNTGPRLERKPLAFQEMQKL